ncbi:sulfate adenylyltransferase [Fictibacillus barbaricus]|uniref:Sulfate adenylyltransferase n=1 Tax=Fictibacillus barbaricus TaxID=182136 RepID=A0ABU1TXX9_9BACL|nr:sulfate adenylyltransferase [Fictibacillus barbaricus]MDR7072052.1 sulfate adenylyltransferase [Fictibacillus barbaricus]
MPIPPHGGKLVNRMKLNDDFQNMKVQIELDAISLSDLECLAIGAFSPLESFMNQTDYLSVIQHMRLNNGIPWSLPITLPVSYKKAKGLFHVKEAALLYESSLFGKIEIEEIYQADHDLESKLVYGTIDETHPGVKKLRERGNWYVGGRITMVNQPRRIIASHYYLEPEKTRELFTSKDWKKIVAFQTRNPVHRAHEYIQKTALENMDGLFLQPLVGETKQDDIPAAVRIKSYETLLENYYPKDRVILGVFPGSMRYAGPREALFHTLIRKNYGCTHMIIGRDHAGVGNFYGPYDAHKIFGEFQEQEIGITPLFFENSFYCNKCQSMATVKTCPHEESDKLILSGTKVREMLRNQEPIPYHYSRPEVVSILRNYYAD